MSLFGGRLPALPGISLCNRRPEFHVIVLLLINQH